MAISKMTNNSLAQKESVLCRLSSRNDGFGMSLCYSNQLGNKIRRQAQVVIQKQHVFKILFKSLFDTCINCSRPPFFRSYVQRNRIRILANRLSRTICRVTVTDKDGLGQIAIGRK